jgi:hypothetical protein
MSGTGGSTGGTTGGTGNAGSSTGGATAGTDAGGAGGESGQGQGADGGMAGGAGESAGGHGGSDAECGDLGEPCCGNSCDTNLACLGQAMCSCASRLFGRYIVRADGRLLYQVDAPSTTQTAVLDSAGQPLTGVTAAMEGHQHGCALRSDKTVWCWRTNASGNQYAQLGSGSTDTTGATFRATQVLSAANQPLTDVTSLSAHNSILGSNTTCAAGANGVLHCWGDLTHIANGGTQIYAPYALPITTDGVTQFGNVLQTALNYGYACSVVQGTSKEVWCWGRNANGQLGTGDQMVRRYPTKVAGLANPTKVTTFGSDQYGAAACALDGSSIRCWGSNNSGQLGLGNTTSPVLTPTLVTLMGGGALNGIADIQGGQRDNLRTDMCAKTSAGTLLCWGFDFETYPTAYAVSNVVDIGTLDGGSVRLLTSDAVYRVDTQLRSPNCGEL